MGRCHSKSWMIAMQGISSLIINNNKEIFLELNTYKRCQKYVHAVTWVKVTNAKLQLKLG